MRTADRGPVVEAAARPELEGAKVEREGPVRGRRTTDGAEIVGQGPDPSDPPHQSDEPAPFEEAAFLQEVAVLRGGRPVLGPVSLRLGRGERWALLGPNGAGKSTLLGLLAGRTRPTSGRARLLGEEVGRCDLRRLRRRIAQAGPSSGRQLADGLTAGEVVRTGLDQSLAPWWSARGSGGRTAAPLGDGRGSGDAAGATVDERVREELARAGLADRADAPFSLLSDGERSRVLLARALVGEPELLLLDEPSVGLDLPAREALVDRIDRLADERPRLTIVLVTHHVEDIPSSVDRVALLRTGRLLARGPIAEVLSGEALGRCFAMRLRVHRLEGRWVAYGRPEASVGAGRPT